MMGTSHAISGAAAWIAVTSSPIVLPALGFHQVGPVGVITGAIVCAGAALLPDADHHNATIAHSVPVAGKVAARTVGKVSGGHRHATHGLIAIVGIVFLTYWLERFQWTPTGWWAGGRTLQIGSIIAVTACVTFGSKVLKIAKTWFRAWVYGVAVGLGVGMFLPDQLNWLPICIGLGFVIHILGDMLTVEGVPLLYPWNPKPPKALASPVWKSNGYFSLPVLGSAGSWREWWLVWAPCTAYVIWGVAANVMAIAGR